MSENVIIRNEDEFRKHASDYHTLNIDDGEEMEVHIQGHHAAHDHYATHSHEPEWDGENRASRIFVVAENEVRFRTAVHGAGFSIERDRHRIFKLVTEMDAVSLRSRHIEWEEWDQVLYAGIPDISIDFFDVLREIGFPAPEIPA